MSDREPGAGQSLDAISSSHPAEHAELQRLADDQSQQALENPAPAPPGPDVRDAMKADAMREQRKMLTDARDRLPGKTGTRADPGEAGPLQQPESRPTGPEADTQPFRRVDAGNTAPQPAIQEADFTQTQPMAALGDLPANSMPRQEDPGNTNGYRGLHRAKEGFEPANPIADMDHEGKHRRTGTLGRLRSSLRNGLNRLRNRG